MKQYHNTVKNVLTSGTYKPNRTEADTISAFSNHYTIDIDYDEFPLLTTKDMLGFRWNSLIHEFFWFLSGEEHIRNLQEETKLWNAWADEEGNLDTAYGRFWRRFPIPNPTDQLPGESWTDNPNHQYVNKEENNTKNGEERYTLDQIEYVLDQLENNPHTRRMIVTAWHPANAVESTLPPCHYTFVLNVQGDELNLHLTQRSGDTALGIPFNIAGYSMLLLMLAQQTGYEPGEFSHTIVDAHIYCGTHERGEWYGNNLPSIKSHMRNIEEQNTSDFIGTEPRTYAELADWIEETAPEERSENESMDHVPGLLRQINREQRDRPTIEIENKGIDQLEPNDISIHDYNPHEGIYFAVAE